MSNLVKTTQQTLFSLTLALVLSIASVTPAPAEHARSPAEHTTAGYFAAASSKSAAAEEAQARYGGKVLSVEEVSEGGGKVYRVKLLLDGGRIKIVTINASHG